VIKTPCGTVGCKFQKIKRSFEIGKKNPIKIKEKL
jgi:hypothetical protein